MIKLDKELQQLQQTVVKMSQTIITMHEKIVEVLNKRDKEKELEIIQLDAFVNHLEEEINDQAISALALLSPVASDLRKVIANIKIATELERMGDYAKNIAIYLIKHDEIDEKVIEYSILMEKEFIYMFNKTMDAYQQADVEAAFEIVDLDKNIDTLFLELKQYLISENDETLYLRLFGISQMLRNIERAGDHAINICEHIIYMIKGRHYDFG